MNKLRLFFAYTFYMADGRKKVLMSFEWRRDHWCVWFRMLPHGIYPRRFTFKDGSKLRDLYMRYGESQVLADRAAFDYAIENGKGIVDLMLGPDQIAVLKDKKAPPGRVGLDATRRRLG